MKNRGIASRLMVVILATSLAAATAGADDPKKPAAIAASSTTSGSKASTASAKPAAVQASTGKSTVREHMKILEAYVPLRMRKDGIEVAQDLKKISVTVMGHDGVEATISFDDWSWARTGSDADVLTALQILVDQKYFEYREGIGFVPTQKYLNIRGIKDDNRGHKSDSHDNTNKQGTFMDATGGPDLVDPGKPESVADDPSQKGGLFGYGYDGPIENYDTSDPNTPEGKKEILRNRLSKLSRQCYATPESTEYRSCRENCSNLLFSEYGKISQDRVNECQRECKGVFEQKKPQVCREANSVQGQLDQLGDER